MKAGRILVVIALVGACTTGSDGTADSGGPETAPPTEATVDAGPDAALTPMPGGTVVFAATETPTTLNAALADGSTLINSFIYAAVLSPLWRITPDFEYEPLLLDGEPDITTAPFSVTYTLKEGLQWNDGTPLTAEDVAFTHRTIMNRRFDVASRRGHDLVRRVRVLDQRRVQFVFARPYGQWRTMFSEAEEAILPRHILEDAHFNSVWDNELTASSGPYEFDSWEEGRLTLKRNEAYWGDFPSLDEVVIAFYPDTATQVRALDAGDVHMLFAPPQPGLLDHLETIEGIEVEVGGTAVSEHIDFNTETPPLDKPFVRHAIAKAIDRDGIIEATASELYPGARPLNSVLWLPQHPQYQDLWSESVAYDRDAAEQLLIDNGCRKHQEVYRCQGTPLELQFTTTSDTPVRADIFSLLEEDLAAIGVKLTSRMAPSDEVFQPDFLASDERWHVFAFPHRGGATMFEAVLPWRCASPGWINVTKYCNRRVERLFERAERATVAERRAELLTQAEREIAADVPTVPLYQQGAYLAWRSTIVGPEHNPSEWGPLWNVGEWVLLQ